MKTFGLHTVCIINQCIVCTKFAHGLLTSKQFSVCTMLHNTRLLTVCTCLHILEVCTRFVYQIICLHMVCSLLNYIWFAQGLHNTRLPTVCTCLHIVEVCTRFAYQNISLHLVCTFILKDRPWSPKVRSYQPARPVRQHASGLAPGSWPARPPASWARSAASQSLP